MPSRESLNLDRGKGAVKLSAATLATLEKTQERLFPAGGWGGEVDGGWDMVFVERRDALWIE